MTIPVTTASAPIVKLGLPFTTPVAFVTDSRSTIIITPLASATIYPVVGTIPSISPVTMTLLITERSASTLSVSWSSSPIVSASLVLIPRRFAIATIIARRTVVHSIISRRSARIWTTFGESIVSRISAERRSSVVLIIRISPLVIRGSVGRNRIAISNESSGRSLSRAGGTKPRANLLYHIGKFIGGCFLFFETCVSLEIKFNSSAVNFHDLN
mmetsp:Transcript_20551/g.44724  ORF Transcript_20551/g.44724 Transcript_20551/m.44724 type:complete len:214 (+) Transcript_20551:626-1267(+)